MFKLLCEISEKIFLARIYTNCTRIFTNKIRVNLCFPPKCLADPPIFVQKIPGNSCPKMLFQSSLCNKNGFLLITAYMVTMVLTILSLAFFAKTINENNLTKIDMKSLAAAYGANKGIECIFVEIENSSKCGAIWETHEVQDALPFQLSQKYTDPSQLPEGFIRLAEYAEIDFNPSSPYYGCYVDKNKDGPSFAVKVYQDLNPNNNNMIALVLGISGSHSRLYVVKICTSSLYEYFWYTPYQLDMSQAIWEGEGGKMHSNGDIVFREDVMINNISEFSTPEYIRYYINSHIPEGNIWDERYQFLRSPWVTPNNGEYYGEIYTEYYNKNDGHIFGDQYGLKMEDTANPGSYISWDGKKIHPPIFPDEMPEIYSGSLIQSSLTQINGQPINNRLSSSYPWNKYYGPSQDYGYTPEYIDVAYTNSLHQSSDWQAYMGSVGLNEIVKEHNTGGESVVPPFVNEDNYKQTAIQNGIYITKDTKAGYQVKINGTDYEPDARGRIIINGEIVFEGVKFKNTNSQNTNAPVVIHIDKMINNALDPASGIIFSETEVMLTDAQTLPLWGLTTVTKENLYIKGNYNTIGWAPSAGITAKFTYLLSDEFNFPTTLPATLHNLEYPYVSDFGPHSNYYADNDRLMPNKVTNNYKYVISLVGYYGYTPQELERWYYPQKLGDKSNPPSNWVSKTREVQGAFVQLEPEDFSAEGTLDFDTARPQRVNPGWPVDMTTIGPTAAYNIFRYEAEYVGPECPIFPPGDLYGLSESVWLEIPTEYWDRHYTPVD